MLASGRLSFCFFKVSFDLFCPGFLECHVEPSSSQAAVAKVVDMVDNVRSFSIRD